MFGSERDAKGEGRRLHNEELHSMYRSPNTVRVIKSKRLRWADYVARMETTLVPSKFQQVNLRKGTSGILHLDERTILEWMLKKCVSI